jgi:hypothetical protein
MKILKWMIGLLAAFVVLNIILYFVLAELGEVVVVDTGQSEMRLWVVDHDGSQWLRRGGGVTGWATELGDEVRMTREGATKLYRPVIVQDEVARIRINELTLEKYGLSERYLWIIGFDTETSVPIRLDPLEKVQI